jgi:hypothetical protein|tara:strand:+ start:725 stop:1684 length:960 start_codon:yes stop_codon:yes gene_type:complete
MNETHIIIDWTCYFDIDFMKSTIHNFKLKLQDIHVHQPLSNKNHVLTRFYNINVDDFRGETPFHIYIIRDNEPIYDYRNTSKGKRIVNTKLFDIKAHLRSIVGGYKIHSTDNIQETKDNLRCLGLFDKYYKQTIFNDINHIFETLNSCYKLQWMVMRNFEQMPDNLLIDEHLDIDLLVNDYFLVKNLLDADSATDYTYEDGGCRILNYVYINNTKVLFDFRFIGDNYYDAQFQKDMMTTRIPRHNFYTPNDRYHIFSLIYHAIIHKPAISDTYTSVFMSYGIEQQDINKPFLKIVLDTFMNKHNYKYVKPEPSVGFFLE